jgi:acyl-CoA synthetase (AMP-forming)/AMP-acid ligase II
VSETATSLCGRTVPDDLAARWRAEGAWLDATLGTLLDGGLRTHGRTGFRVFSESRPYDGCVGDLAGRARRLAGGLSQRNVGAGDVVAYQFPNWAEAAVVFWAASLLGATVVPVAHFYGAKELRYILEHTSARVLLTPDRFGRIDYSERLPMLLAEVPGLDTVAVDGPAVPAGAMPFARLLDADPVEIPAAVSPDAPAVIAFTSGTTAQPKGVVHTHRTLVAEMLQLPRFEAPAGTGPGLTASPVSHITGMITLWAPVMGGREINLLDKWDVSTVLDLVVGHGFAAGGGATFFLTSLLDSPDFGEAHLARMTAVALGGAPIPAAVAERADALGISVIRAYGSTEHPSTTGGSHAGDGRDKRLFTDGRPMPWVEVRVVGPDGVEVGPGRQGEIHSRGPDLFVGYTDAALTAAAIDADGWYATGDVGFLDDDGYLTITDRIKDVIIRGGENISAVEVEELVQELASVAEVAIVAAPDARTGEHACAFVRPQRGASVDLGAIRAHLAARGLAKQKWPEELRIVTDFDRTASGKIKKFVLRDMLRGHATQ